MERLPDELVLATLALLEPWDMASLQQTCRRFLSLGRDPSLWRRLCFESSRQEAARRRAQLLSREHTLSALRRALSTHPAGWRRLVGSDDEAESTVAESSGQAPAAEEQQRSISRPSYTALLSRWDPSGPNERVDWHREYQHRHGPLSVGWLETPRDGSGYSQLQREALGLAAVYEHGVATSCLSPLDDGSLCLWNLQTSNSRRLGGVSARTAPNFLRIPNSPTEEPGSLDTVTVDSSQRQAYVGVGDTLYQIDLQMLQIASQRSYGTPITVLSAAAPSVPLTVGTLHALHQHDPREPVRRLAVTNVEHIAGANPRAAASLPQPGPLALLHPPDSHSVWVAGRFTSLLHYDRRHWPRLASTHFSGARLAALDYLPSSPSTLPCSSPAGTLLAAGAYKGKGSLELYGLGEAAGKSYTNRHAAARSRILCATSHAARVLISDGDGALRWLERDANSSVRATSLSLLEADGASFVYEEDRWARGRRHAGHRRADSSSSSSEQDSGYASATTSRNEGRDSLAYRRARLEARRERREHAEDVVQRLVPVTADRETQRAEGREMPGNGGVLLQTGEGRVGLLSFCKGDPLAPGSRGARASKDGSQQQEDQQQEDDDCDDDEQAWLDRHHDDDGDEAEHDYDAAVRRALVATERDLHWLRGLGQR